MPSHRRQILKRSRMGFLPVAARAQSSSLGFVVGLGFTDSLEHQAAMAFGKIKLGVTLAAGLTAFL